MKVVIKVRHFTDNYLICNIISSVLFCLTCTKGVTSFACCLDSFMSVLRKFVHFCIAFSSLSGAGAMALLAVPVRLTPGAAAPFCSVVPWEVVTFCSVVPREVVTGGAAATTLRACTGFACITMTADEPSPLGLTTATGLLQLVTTGCRPVVCGDG